MSRCPMHPPKYAPVATVRVGARNYCEPCAEGMFAVVRASNFRDLEVTIERIKTSAARALVRDGQTTAEEAIRISRRDAVDAEMIPDG